MSRTLAASLLVVALCTNGCNRNSADAVMKDNIAAMNELADAVESNAPEGKISEIQKRLEENNKKLEDLKLSEEEKKQLIERHKDEYTKAANRLANLALGQAFRNLGKNFQQNPFAINLPAAPDNGQATPKAQLTGKWLIDSATVEFRTDGTFEGRLPQFDLSDSVAGIYDWPTPEHVSLRKPNKGNKQVKVVIQGDDLTLIGDDAVVVRGKRWTAERQKALDDERNEKELKLKGETKAPEKPEKK